MITFLFCVVASGGGWIIGLIIYILMNCLQGSGEKIKVNETDRYQLIDMTKGMKVVGSSNDYQQAFKMKTKLGNGIIIKNTGEHISNLRRM